MGGNVPIYRHLYLDEDFDGIRDSDERTSYILKATKSIHYISENYVPDEELINPEDIVSDVMTAKSSGEMSTQE